VRERLVSNAKDVYTQLQEVEKYVPGKTVDGEPQATGLADFWKEFIDDYVREVHKEARDWFTTRAKIARDTWDEKIKHLKDNMPNIEASDKDNAQQWIDNLTQLNKVLDRYETESKKYMENPAPIFT
jgi:hypothetical protein